MKSANQITGWASNILLVVVVGCLAFWILIRALTIYNAGTISLETYLTVEKVLHVLVLIAIIPRLTLRISMVALVRLIIIIYFIVYFYQVFFLDIRRPELVTESNIELVFVLVLYFILHADLSLILRIIVYSTFILSGSFSAIGSLLAVTIYKSLGLVNYKRILVLCLIAVSVLATLSLSRGYSSYENVDRIVFFLLAIADVSQGDSFSWIWGQPPISTIPATSCMTWAMTIPGNSHSCYSPAYNLQVARLLYDFGVIGFPGFFIVLYYILKSKGFSTHNARGVTLIGFLNGLSVGGIGSTYFASAILLLMLLKYNILKREA